MSPRGNGFLLVEVARINAFFAGHVAGQKNYDAYTWGPVVRIPYCLSCGLGLPVRNPKINVKEHDSVSDGN